MLFNSIDFLVFFLVVLAIYPLLPHYGQNIFLLLMSYIFYAMWSWKCLGLIWISTAIDYFCGLSIEKTSQTSRRKIILLLSLTSNLFILGFFKYYHFFISNFAELLNVAGLSFHPNTLHIILPVGISFYTFQSMSYSLDIYRGQCKPTRDFVAFSLYVSFFPQLVAGPIERAQNFLPQILSPRQMNIKSLQKGICLILWGLFKKAAVADRLALYVDAVYGNVSQHTGITFILATVLFAFQIYCDFSGYSDIARGTAKMLGFDLIINFKTPYFALNIRDFWKRWHISLSIWLRDYLYIPLGGNKKGGFMTLRNLMITMLLGGLWHGANWTFVIWGGLHGVYIILTHFYERYFSGKIPKLPILGWAATFTFVCFTWIFFRANTLQNACWILSQILNPAAWTLWLSPRHLTLGITSLFVVCIVEFISKDKFEREVLECKSPIAQTVIFYTIIFSLIFLGVFGTNQFIYFQF